MNARVATGKALTAYIAHKALNTLSIFIYSCILFIFVLIACLAYYLSAWWWLVAIPFVLLLLVIFASHLLLIRLIKLIHRHPFTAAQRKALRAFSDKLIHLNDVRSFTPAFLALRSLYDVLRHRDVTTIKSIISDSKSLRSDFHELEKFFGTTS